MQPCLLYMEEVLFLNLRVRMKFTFFIHITIMSATSNIGRRWLPSPFTISRKTKQMKNKLPFLLVVLCLFTTTNPLHAQWILTGLDGFYVRTITVSGTNLFVGTSGDGVFLSTNSGTSWSAVNTGLTNIYVNAFAVSATNLFVGTEGDGVFRSTNNGTSWSATATLTDPYVYALAVSPDSSGNLFAGADGGGVSLSTNNGTSWIAASAGLTNTRVFALAISGTNLFAGTFGGGVFLSTNSGTSWTAASSGLTNTDVNALAVSGTDLFASTAGGVFRSTNNGTNWAAASTGLTNTVIWVLAVYGTNLFAGTNGDGIWRRPLSEITTAAERPASDLPIDFGLDQNYPNPFNPTTEIGFRITDFEMVSLKVFDVLGREVASLVNEEKSPGSYSVRWDATNVGSGMYFYRLESSGRHEIRKMVLMK